MHRLAHIKAMLHGSEIIADVCYVFHAHNNVPYFSGLASFCRGEKSRKISVMALIFCTPCLHHVYLLKGYSGAD